MIMIIEILTAATAGSTIVLALAINASRAQVRGLAKELNKKTIQHAKQTTRVLDLQAEARAEKDKAKMWEDRGGDCAKRLLIAENDLAAALQKLFALEARESVRREQARVRKARHRAKVKEAKNDGSPK
jgi:hypothetical protein